MKKTVFATLVLFTALSQSHSLLAQETAAPRHPLLENKFSLGVGAFVFDKEIKIRVNGQEAGDNIDFDENWGVLSDDSSFSGVFRWRFGEKWSLWGQYFESDDSASAVLEEDVEWEGLTFKQGTNVGAGVDLSVARIFAGRIFSEGPKHEFGLGVGLHWLDFGAYLEGEIIVDDVTTGFQRSSVGADAPLPNIGGWYGYAFTPKWLASARLDWLYVSIGDYEGGLYNGSLGIQYQAFKHVGFNLAYQVFGLDLDVTKSSWNGSVDLDYYGPFFSVTANW